MSRRIHQSVLEARQAAEALDTATRLERVRLQEELVRIQQEDDIKRASVEERERSNYGT